MKSSTHHLYKPKSCKRWRIRFRWIDGPRIGLLECPASESLETSKRLRDLALAAHIALGLRPDRCLARRKPSCSIKTAKPPANAPESKFDP